MERLLFAGEIVLFSTIWSSAFIAGAIALSAFDPYTLLTLRFAASAPLLWLLCRGGTAVLFDRRVVERGLLLGLLNNAVYLGLSFTALRSLRPEVVIVVISCAPFVTTVLAAAGGERLRPASLFGMALGFAGVVIISGVFGVDRPDPLGLALATGGMLAFAGATVLFRHAPATLPLLPVTFWQTVAGAGALLPVALLLGQPLTVPSGPALLALIHLVLVVTIGGMALWLSLIRRHGAALASSTHLLNPFLGAVQAALILGTPLRPSDFAGAALIALGLILVGRFGSLARNRGGGASSPRPGANPDGALG